MMNKPASRFDLWSSLINQKGYARCAEVGVWKGEFAANILKSCPCVREYLMIDSWRHLPGWNKPFNISDNDFKVVFDTALASTSFASDRRRILRGTTLEMQKEIEPDSLDFIYIDGDHSLRGIVIDALVMWEKLKVGGMLAGDDFTAEPWQHGPAYEPTLVNPFMHYFAEAMGCTLHLPGLNQFFLIKGDSCQSGSEKTLPPSMLELLQTQKTSKKKSLLSAFLRKLGR